MELSTTEFLQGGLSLIFVILSFLIGIKILLKYFEFKKRVFYLVGLSWIGLSNPWYPDAINFISIIVFDISLPREAAFIIGYGFLPVFVMLWLTAFTDFLYKKRQKLILLPFLIIYTIFEGLFYYLLFTNIEQLGTFITPFQIRWSIFMELFLLSFIVTAMITGIIFAWASIKSKNPEVSLKGKFILIAFISFTAGAIIEALFHLDPVLVVITRSILISSAIEFYFGFILPNWIKKYFVKEK